MTTERKQEGGASSNPLSGAELAELAAIARANAAWDRAPQTFASFAQAASWLTASASRAQPHTSTGDAA